MRFRTYLTFLSPKLFRVRGRRHKHLFIMFGRRGQDESIIASIGQTTHHSRYLGVGGRPRSTTLTSGITTDGSATGSVVNTHTTQGVREMKGKQTRKKFGFTGWRKPAHLRKAWLSRPSDREGQSEPESVSSSPPSLPSLPDFDHSLYDSVDGSYQGFRPGNMDNQYVVTVSVLSCHRLRQTGLIGQS
jgi:hypothetical protein